ncbi:hypothetical protein QR680_006055 [Steinernema hermaphroditum]|uniref:Uncharacterized protein n=1 Tax=Steinernema hermaphroditum TaxID=289476 RepID=A0AA39LVW4_9BILA|nr:hypothetical protein QR680_006055 [Steinernema hermaphroditum]
MFLIVTICVLFIYTLVLIFFFMGWCTMIPNMCHPRREVPFSSVKSPRRNTRFNDIESMSSSQSLDGASRSPLPFEDTHKLSLVNLKPMRYNDYLHPKYSLPPMKIDVTQQQMEYERFLRTPIRAHRSSKEKLDKASDQVVIEIPEMPVAVPYVV